MRHTEISNPSTVAVARQCSPQSAFDTYRDPEEIGLFYKHRRPFSLRGLLGLLFLVFLFAVGEHRGVWVYLAELEHLLHRLELVLHPLHLFLGVSQVGHRAVEQLGDNTFRDTLDRVPLLLGEPTKHLLSLSQLLLSNILSLLTEHLDGRDATQRLLPAFEITDLALNQDLCFLHGSHALLLVGINDLLEVIDVVRDDSLGFLRVVVHVHRHTDVHKHQLLSVARILLEGGLRNQGVLRERGGEDDVRLADLLPHLVEGVQRHVDVREHLRQPLHAFAAAVNNVQGLLGVGAGKMGHQQPGHFSGSNDCYPCVFEVHTKVFIHLHLRQLSRRGRDRDSTLGNTGFRADAFAGGHGDVEQLAQDLAEAPVIIPTVGGAVFDLAENLAFANDQRVQAT
mmetsp:Transcript_16163/g.30685  ORF Transcript_16163/g.30685 Transcript_16163/m.30685 type:complete len:396 (-) Transcript_16163:658-1845(-)